MKNLYSNTKPTLLIILDGFGFSLKKKYNPILFSKKPNLNYYFSHYPWTTLKSSGKYVGLPNGYVGNSEVGHLTIGAGKTIPQAVTIINKAIKDKSFFKNKILTNNLNKLHANNGTLHIMGLLSDAGVHSHINHLIAFLKLAIKLNIKKIYIHVFLDGRDVAPKSAKLYLQKLESFISKYDFIKIVSLHGRYYAMDRDKNWDRIKKSYDVLTNKQKIKFQNWKEVLNYFYDKNLTDEFIPPTQLDHYGIIKNNDGIIFFNFRPDRAIQLTSCFVSKKTKKIKLQKKLKIGFLITPVSYSNSLETTNILKKKKINNTLMDILSSKRYKSLSIAETEKYAHITYFFRGGRKEPYLNETDVLIPSIHPKNYINFPCMSSKKITDFVLKALNKKLFNFYLINYANLDMVGHSGNFEATVKAIECLDEHIGKIYKEVIENQDGIIYITGDHGNAEIKFNEKSNQPSTAHTRNEVPFLFIKNSCKDKKINLSLHELADIKNFILNNLNKL